MVTHARSDADPLRWHATAAERTHAAWIHGAALALDVVAAVSAGVGMPIPLAVVLILWLVKRDLSPFVDDHGKEALNFQISLTIYAVIAWALAAVLIGFALLPILAVLALVGTIRGISAARDGRAYRYPMCIRLIR